MGDDAAGESLGRSKRRLGRMNGVGGRRWGQNKISVEGSVLGVDFLELLVLVEKENRLVERADALELHVVPTAYFANGMVVEE